jgi:hypothetical protein
MIIRNHKPKPLELTKDQIASIRKKRQSSPEPMSEQVSIQKQDDPKPNIGLGDRVERIAQPIARVIDRVAGTNIQGCGACQKRKEYLNKKFPNT